jgi:erythromycin esterase-like protein
MITRMNSFLRIGILFLTVSAAAWGFQDSEPALTDWIATHAVRIKTPAAGNGFDDLQPLKKVVGNARIVSLGEATHGTREFFQLKHRLVEFLASEMGFTIFSIEANMPEAYKLNDYVLNGNGDPAQLLRGLYFWTWDTEEVLDMIRWMREFNKSGKGRIEFTGFDMQTPDVAQQIVSDFVAKNDSDYARLLAESVRQLKSSQAPAASFGVATARFPIKDAAGHRVHYSGYIKTEDVTEGYAGLWWRVDGKTGVLAFDNMQDRGVKGTTEWKRYEITLPVAADTTNINFGALMPGNGTAWFDSLAIELDGQPYSNPTEFDFDFESAPPKGFFIGGAGYQVQLDSQTAHTGKQSLRMKRLSTPDSNATASQAAAAAWTEVLHHLEGRRAAYRAMGSTDREVDWIIQNAWIVLQGLQMRANTLSRDRSMADNVKWILDQNPNAKIVLWAHNGHVGSAGSESMGSALRRAYGNQMVVFGFAFNQGSFQAVESGKSLRDFTVLPRAGATLDAALASPRIPLYALDLRDLPKTGPVSDWFHQVQMTRSIGAVYSEDTASQFIAPMKAAENFDVVLYVDQTTAARKNPAR